MSKKISSIRVNEVIEAPKIRVVGPEGEYVGERTVAEALVLAREAGLDLVEVSPNAEPPVCKILDFGRYKYDIRKKDRRAQLRSGSADLKEIRLRTKIEKHDFDVKVRRILRFLEKGHRVKVAVVFRGREIMHQQIGKDLMERVTTQIAPKCKVIQDAAMDGKSLIMVVDAAKSK